MVDLLIELLLRDLEAPRAAFASFGPDAFEFGRGSQARERTSEQSFKCRLSFLEVKPLK